MQHVDPDRLVLLALGEAAPDPTESGHVARCVACRDDLDATRQVADLGRLTQDLADLPPPPPQVWQRIAATTDVTAGPAVTRTLPGLAGSDPGSAATRPDRAGSAAPNERSGRAISASGSRRSRRPRLRVAGLVAATAAAVTATLAVPRLVDGPPAEPVAATADLAAVATAPTGASGVARVLGADGGERLHLHVTGLPERASYYEVWLIDPDTSRMVAVGVLRGGGDELLPLPSTIDLRRYRLVDVSAEDYDGEVAHSGQSLLRGTLAV